jgi:predicted RNA polymerase sigma factor
VAGRRERAARHPGRLRALGRAAEARRADERTLTLTANPAERALLEQRPA